MIRSLRERLKTKFVDRKPRPLPNPLPQLETIPVPVFRVTREQLGSFIEKIYGWRFDWDVIAQPGMTLEFRVDGALDSPAWQDRADDLRCGRKTSDLQLVLDTLAHDGLIPTGQYFVLSAPGKG